MDSSRFCAQWLNQAFVVQLFFTRVHVARPARGERDSCLLARLQQA